MAFQQPSEPLGSTLDPMELISQLMTVRNDDRHNQLSKTKSEVLFQPNFFNRTNAQCLDSSFRSTVYDHEEVDDDPFAEALNFGVELELVAQPSSEVVQLKLKSNASPDQDEKDLPELDESNHFFDF